MRQVDVEAIGQAVLDAIAEVTEQLTAPQLVSIVVATVWVQDGEFWTFAKTDTLPED